MKRINNISHPKNINKVSKNKFDKIIIPKRKYINNYDNNLYQQMNIMPIPMNTFPYKNPNLMRNNIDYNHAMNSLNDIN